MLKIKFFLIFLSFQFIYSFSKDLQINSSNENLQNNEKNLILTNLQNIIHDITQSIYPSLVSIDVKGISDIPKNVNPDPLFTFFFGNAENISRQYFSVGSGFIISDDGYILSNWHQIKNANQINITLYNGKSYPANLMGADTELNIALLKIEADNLQKIPIGNSDTIKIGDFSFAFGNPFSLSQSLTFGIISSLGRQNFLPGLEYFIQSNIPVDSISSGGPLVNIEGQTIGINTCVINKKGEPLGLSYAIPINIAIDIAEKILDPASDERAFLGVVPQELDKITQQIMDIQESGGVVISSINNDSPAEKSGLKQGDIITKIDSQSINSIKNLSSFISSKKANSSLEIEILRGKRREKIILTLASRPSPLIRKIKNPAAKISARIVDFKGVIFEDPSSEELKKNGASDGVIIRKVNPDSPFVFILSTDDIISSINNFEVQNIQNLSQIIETQKNKNLFSFGVYSHGFFVYRSAKDLNNLP